MKKSKQYLRDIVLGSLFTALGVLTPQIFHLFGAVAGQTFLPMHIPVLIAGLCSSPLSAGIAGILSPLISSFITGMPTPVKMPFMCIELFTYGIVSALCMRFLKGKIKNATLRIYLSLIISQICGRAVNILCTIAAVKLLGMTHPAVSISAVLLSVPTGFIGIVIQLIFIPPVVVAINRYVTIGRKN